MKTTLLDLYRGPLSIWVEDTLTHEVLTELWADPQINVLVANGKPAVLYLIRSRPERFRSRVYGVVDRDFERDNQAQWLEPTESVLRLPAHELENLLLDFEVLSQLSGMESAADVEARARKCAGELVYWMACKGVLRDMQKSLGAAFPADPRTDVCSEQKRLAELQSQEQRLRADLKTDAWQQSFSGKELFRRLRERVPKLDATAQRPPYPTSASRNLNLAKQITRKMRELGRIPPAIAELHQVLRRKANL